MNVAGILAILQALLPVIERDTALFIHNPTSQNKLAITFGEVETVAKVASDASAVSQAISAAKNAQSAS